MSLTVHRCQAHRLLDLCPCIGSCSYRERAEFLRFVLGSVQLEARDEQPCLTAYRTY
jgi:hypothetical protein